MARRKVRLRVGQPAARYSMLVVVLATMGDTGVFLVLLVCMPVMLVTLVVLLLLERLAQVHLHVAPVCAPAIHHDIVSLVRVVLIEHSELLGRLRAGRSRRGGGVWVEGCSSARGRRANAGGVVAVEVLVVVWVVGLARSPLVSRVVGHQRVSHRVV